MVTGIICEYNPYHNGHKKQLDAIRSTDPEGGIVCLMSGNYVQRGMPAIIDKMHRAKAAVLTGADLVLELPVTAALSSAEGFAATGVSILKGFCDRLCFGAETADVELLKATAASLLSEEYTKALRLQLEKGVSFPVARQEALQSLGLDADFIAKPNNILAIEYCKAMLAQNSQMQPYPIFRDGNYHATTPDTENPSATFLRQQMQENADRTSYMPKEAAQCFENAILHNLANGERGILYRLRTMRDEDFEALPYGSEGLWRKLMHAARKHCSLEDIINETKSKRYTRTRINRMIMCAYLGITEEIRLAPIPYVRVLAFNEKGRKVLKNARKYGNFINIGQKADNPYQALENRCGSLYGLFADSNPEKPNKEEKERVIAL